MSDPQTLQSSLPTWTYPVLFATIGGSHAFDCADDHSDYDVHGVHLVPLTTVLGLSGPGETVERKSTYRDNEVDIVTHDLKKFILLMLKGNGNALEDLYSPLVVVTSPIHDELKALGKGCITKRLSAHYKGMAYNQRRGLKTEHAVKPLLHAYRCILMGLHLMQHGTLEMSLPTLANQYESLVLQRIYDLIALKHNGVSSLLQDDIDKHIACIEVITALLDQETAMSAMHSSPTQETQNQLERLLTQTRIADALTRVVTDKAPTSQYMLIDIDMAKKYIMQQYATKDGVQHGTH